MLQYIGAVIAVRNIFTPLCLFIQTSPNNFAVASGNGNIFLHINCTFKLQVNFDRHNAGLTFNYCPLSGILYKKVLFSEFVIGFLFYFGALE